MLSKEDRKVGKYIQNSKTLDIYLAIEKEKFVKCYGHLPWEDSTCIIDPSGRITQLIEYDKCVPWTPKHNERIWVEVKQGDSTFYPTKTGRGFCITDYSTRMSVSLVAPIVMDDGRDWYDVPIESVHPAAFGPKPKEVIPAAPKAEEKEKPSMKITMTFEIKGSSYDDIVKELESFVSKMKK